MIYLINHYRNNYREHKMHRQILELYVLEDNPYIHHHGLDQRTIYRIKELKD